MKVNYKALLGVASVHNSESVYARKMGKRLEWLVLAALFAVFIQLLMYYVDQPFESVWFSNLIWGVFALELGVNLSLVRNRLRYLRENWMNLLIVLLAFPLNDWGGDWVFIIRFVRLILFLRFFTVFFKGATTILRRNKFGQILLVFAFIIAGGGALFAYLEDRTVVEGIWYAIVTVTTVGYGDVVPSSEGGRAFGTVLILFGVVFFSLVSANIAAFLIGSDQKALEKDVLRHLNETEQRFAKQSAENEQHVERLMTHFSKEIEALKKALSEEKSK